MKTNTSDPNQRIQRLLRAKNKEKGRYYLIGLFILLCAIYIVDEISSNINSTMQPQVILDLFRIPGGNVLSREYTKAVGIFTAVSMVSYVFMLIAPFYKSLADRFGRKPFLILNTFLMGVGMLICMIAPNFIIYIVGALVITFVKSNDMQVMYIIETAPAKHRAKLCNLTKAVALVSVALIGVFRNLFYDENNLSSWRLVFLIPAVMGIAIALICIPLIRETPVFIDRQLKKLGYQGTDQEDEGSGDGPVETVEKKSKDGGVLPALRMIFHDKQLRRILIAAMAFGLVTGITSYYTSVLEAARSAGRLTAHTISTVLIIFPFVNGLFTFICGFISDAVGRKKACFIYSVIAMAGLALFVLGARFGASAAVIGLGWGMFIGTIWSTTDTLILVMPAESTPTGMRASVMGVMSLLLSVALAVSIVLAVIGMNIVGTADFGLLDLCVSIPLIVVACILLSRVEETRGNDLDR